MRRGWLDSAAEVVKTVLVCEGAYLFTVERGFKRSARALRNIKSEP